jgi:hypothetical protein
MSLPILGVTFLCAIALLFIHVSIETRKLSKMSPEQRREHLSELQLQQKVKLFGVVNPALVCPHCQVKGHIRTKAVDRKKGVSGGKATAALLTAGVSLMATGLSRKERATHAQCDNCGSEWDF